MSTNVSQEQSISEFCVTDITEKNSLDELGDEELVQQVDLLRIESNYIDTENEVYEHFLNKNDPALIAGMAQVLENAGKLLLWAPSVQGVGSLVWGPSRKETEESIPTSSRDAKSIRIGTLSTITPEKGPRINISQKIDLVMREMEEMQLVLEDLTEKSFRIKWNYKAEIEETLIRTSEVKEAREIFDQSIVIQGIDPLTQRIPAEKFVRYMDEWLKSAESTIEKMRLRTATLKSRLYKVKAQIIQREQLGETIHPVDFEKLRIENQHLYEKIEQKNYHLIELKIMNGRANLVLSTHKKYLQVQVKELNTIKESIKSIKQKIIDLESENDVADEEVITAQMGYDRIRELYDNYQVPDIYEYAKKKTQLYELKKKVKIWSRKNNILQFAMTTYTRKMKNLTGLKTPRQSWFKMPQLKDSFDLFVEENYPNKTNQ